MFTNEFSKEVWATTYKDHNDKNVSDTMRRVAKTMAAGEATEELKRYWEEKFFNYLNSFVITVGGRTYSNAGTEWNGTTFINCFVGKTATYDCDSLDGILKVLRDQAQTLKSEGGWGMNFSFIRPRGSFIHGVGVETPGAVKYMELFDKSSEIVTSGSGKESNNSKAKGKIRKGAQMAVLCDWHPDIIEFITAKQTPGRLTKFNVSVGFSDDFMTRLDRITHIEKLLAKEEDDAKAEKLRDAIDVLDVWELQYPQTTFEKYKAEWDGDLQAWKKKGYPVSTHGYTSVRTMWNLVMESTYSRADPGVLFLDRANYFNPLNYLEKIHSTNPCLTGDTEVLTSQGYKRLDSLVGNKVTVWNGVEWSEVEPKITAENQKIIDIEFSNGSILSCTPYHGFFLKDGSRVEAKDLSEGDKLQKFMFPVIEGGTTLEESYTHGFYSGDGSINRNEIWLYGNKCQLLPYFPIKSVTDQSTSTIERKVIVLNLQKENLNKEFVPDTNYSVLSRLSWLAGLLDSDGTVLKDGSIQITSINKSFLSNVLKMLNTLGVRGVISLNKPAEAKLMPNGRGGTSLYQCQDCYRLSISGTTVCSLVGMGFYSNRCDLSYIPSRESSRSISVVRKTERPGLEKFVYCFNEPKRHTAIFNGVMTGQCGEQVLAPGGCCNLGSINLTQFVNDTGFDFAKLEDATRVLVRLLDNVNTVSSAPLPEYVDSMRNKRRVGVGIMGWGSLLYMMNTRFGSEDANVLREEIMSTIARTAYMYSIDLAEEKGMFSYCDPKKHAEAAFIKLLDLPEAYTEKLKKFGIRNSSLLSIQPTGNTGIFANVVSGGCEPVFLPEYVRTAGLNTPPDHLAHLMPKYWEGEFMETEMFKLVKEGEDELLRGVDTDGTVYKIDRNRGLTKEVICEDYGVWWLKQRNEWDPEADWAVCTNDLQVADHLNDLAGFARWVDSAISKTVNVPNEYPFEEFKNIYLDAYRSGYVKGVTTYRSGTMMSVLSAKDEKSASLEEEEIILEDVKLPESAPAMVKTLKVEGKKWYLTVVMNESNNRPFALFVTTNVHEPNVTTFDVTERLLELALTKGIPQKHIDEIEQKIKRDSNHAKMARVISLLLRHGVFIREIIRVLDPVENVFVGSFLFQIKKFLSTFIKDGEKAVGEKCTECGSTNVVFSEGCRKCANCGSSKCG